MKALSIRQPWAWAILTGAKPVENRTWFCRHLGPLLIHAGKSFDRDGLDFIRDRFPDLALPAPETLPLGGIVGRVEMTGCVAAHASPWFFGPFGFVFERPEPLAFTPCRGALGLFEADEPPTRETRP